MRRKTTPNRRLIWIIRGFVFGIFILFLWSLGRNLVGLSQLDERLVTARNEIDILRQENLKLQEQAEEAQSPLQEEKDIRNKLGLTKPGETVVLIPDDVWDELYISTESARPVEPPHIPVWKQWVNLFL